MKYRIKNTQTTILILGIYQLLGGIAGLIITAYWAMHTELINGPILLIFLIATGLYLFSIKSGTLLLWKDYKKGLIYSIINQAIQILSVGFGGYKFRYSSGANGIFGLNFTNGFELKISFALASDFNISINVNNTEYFIYLNLLAIFLFFAFYDIYEELFSKKSKKNDDKNKS